MRVAAGALCGTDLHIAHGTLRVSTPRILGHELAGTVAEIGSQVDGFEVGQRITTETDAHFCGTCRFCRAGDMHLCSERTGIGTSADGGFAEYVALPAGGVHLLPAGIDLEAGALTEPLAVAVRAVLERGDVQDGERVAVVGPGPIGLLAAQVAAAQGADVTLVGLTRHAARLEFARGLGVPSTLVLDGAGDGGTIGADGMMDVAVECSGSAAGLRSAIRFLRKGGRLVLVGFHGAPVAVDLDTIVNRELAIVASRGKRPTSFRLALEFMASGAIDPGRLITHRFALPQWEQAFRAAEGPGAKVLLLM